MHGQLCDDVNANVHCFLSSIASAADVGSLPLASLASALASSICMSPSVSIAPLSSLDAANLRQSAQVVHFCAAVCLFSQLKGQLARAIADRRLLATT